MRLLYLLAALIVVAFLLLLVVGFENVLEVFRYLVTLVLVVGPLVGLFIWSLYMAFFSKKDPKERRLGLKDKP